MDLLARLDRFVHVTRLDLLTPYAERRPRNLSWLPLFHLMALVVGYGLWMMALRQTVPLWAGLMGATFFCLTVLSAALLPLWGPRTEETGPPLDERDRALQDRAGNLSGRIFEVMVMLACGYFAFASLSGGWMPETAAEWGPLALGAFAAPRLLRLLVAGWMQPPLEEED